MFGEKRVIGELGTMITSLCFKENIGISSGRLEKEDVDTSGVGRTSIK